MVFGELVDSVPIFGSQRRSYILIGAALTACGLLTLAGAAGGWIVLHARPTSSTSARRTADRDRDGDPGRRRGRDVDRGRGPRDETGRQCAARRTTSAPNSAWCRCSAASRCRLGILAVAGLSGWLAGFLPRETVFLLGLIVPAISVIGVLLIRSEASRAAADRLAHPGRRPGVRRRRAGACARRRAVRAGDDLHRSRWR